MLCSPLVLQNIVLQAQLCTVPLYLLVCRAHNNCFMIKNSVYSFCVFLPRAVYLHCHPSSDTYLDMSKINEAFIFGLDATEVNIVSLLWNKNELISALQILD